MNEIRKRLLDQVNYCKYSIALKYVLAQLAGATEYINCISAER